MREAASHPKTKKLLSELKAWCDQEFGRRSEVARLIGVSPATINDWLKGREGRYPTLDQGFSIQDLLAKERRKQRRAK